MGAKPDTFTGGPLSAKVAELERENALLKARIAVLTQDDEAEDIPGLDLMVEHKLPRQQAEVLRALIVARGRPVSRIGLEMAITLRDHAADVCPKLIDVLLSKLRKRLGPDIIETVPGAGWRIATAKPAQQARHAPLVFAYGGQP